MGRCITHRTPDAIHTLPYYYRKILAGFLDRSTTLNHDVDCARVASFLSSFIFEKTHSNSDVDVRVGLLDHKAWQLAPQQYQT